MTGPISSPVYGANAPRSPRGADEIPVTRKRVSREQCRAARALLGLTQAQLAAEASIARRTLIYFEVGKRPLQRRTLVHITSVLETAGIELVMADGVGGQGVRFRAARTVFGNRRGDTAPIGAAAKQLRNS